MEGGTVTGPRSGATRCCSDPVYLPTGSLWPFLRTMYENLSVWNPNFFNLVFFCWKHKSDSMSQGADAPKRQKTIAKLTQKFLWKSFSTTRPHLFPPEGFPKNVPRQNETSKHPAKKKKKEKKRKAKRKKRGERKVKGRTRDCCVTSAWPTFGKQYFLIWKSRPHSVRPVNGFLVRFSS